MVNWLVNQGAGIIPRISILGWAHMFLLSGASCRIQLLLVQGTFNGSCGICDKSVFCRSAASMGQDDLVGRGLAL
jgi:hypothetical protein